MWLSNGRIITPGGILRGAVHVERSHIAAIVRNIQRHIEKVNLHGAYLAPGFIDLHVWGLPATVSREVVRGGTTAFLSALGPDAPKRLAQEVALRAAMESEDGAACLGLHLEGPFLNTARKGALPRRWMRRPSVGELRLLSRLAGGRLKLMTIAPELPGARSAIRWCRRHRIVASLGHSEANAKTAQEAVADGARGVTHVFNGMRPFHHRHAGLIDAALTDPRLTTMVILDGVHVSPAAFRLLVRAKGVEGVALVTDSIRRQGWNVVARNGAYYTKHGTLAGSALTMMHAVRNAVQLGGVALADAVTMASAVPARLLGDRSRGRLAVGARADLVAFNERFQVLMTIVNGKIVYQQGH